MSQFLQVRKALDTKWRHRGRIIWLITLAIAFGLTFLVFQFSLYFPRTPSHGGNCAAIGQRRPKWADSEKMRSRISEFVGIFNQRPIRDNLGGMRFDHSFALWYMLKVIQPQPSTVIESGAFRGHSTWIIRQALPHVRIISISPDTPDLKVRNTVYINGGQFIDFNQIHWDKLKVNPKTALVFFDDHQSIYRRIFQEGISRGFRRFISDDNYEYLEGDQLSMKWLCEVERSSEWRGKVPDNFGRTSMRQTWRQHISVARSLDSTIKYYYEFPPTATSNLTGQSRFKEERATPALINDSATFSKMLGGIPTAEFSFYTHMCYVETKWKMKATPEDIEIGNFGTGFTFFWLTTHTRNSERYKELDTLCTEMLKYFKSFKYISTFRRFQIFKTNSCRCRTMQNKAFCAGIVQR